MLPLEKFHQRMIALLVIPLLIAESAIAAASVEMPSITVRYHDLDLNGPAGVASLYERIHAAAVEVCKPAEGPQPVNRAFPTDWDTCVNHAVALAVRAVHNEKLSAYHWERIRGWKSH
jgi:UrcA family protein